MRTWSKLEGDAALSGCEVPVRAEFRSKEKRCFLLISKPGDTVVTTFGGDEQASLVSRVLSPHLENLLIRQPNVKPRSNI